MAWPTSQIAGPITVQPSVRRLIVERFPGGGGKLDFYMTQSLMAGGVEIGISAEGNRKYEADFVTLPATFPVTINGNVVQVSGQTILDALDAVALAVVQAAG